MRQYSLFQMYEPFRQSLIAEHRFYVDQARQRLLSQFDDIESEANRASAEWLEKNGHRFDPDRHDEASFLESAHDAGLEFYELLNAMRTRTQLSVVAGMYHEWDKRFRKWLVGDISRWCRGDAVSSKIWTVDIGKLINFLEGLGWEIKSQCYFSKLDACRVVVNVYKHGEGNSLNELKHRYREYFSHPLSNIGSGYSYLDHIDDSHLLVTDKQLQEFSDAIVSFWQSVPAEIYEKEDLDFPDWFVKAANK
ncbi:MAG: hypothetical protein CMQ46_10445 [Gammaproteobacteria bacterium]|nr:hypothetical protein [Gammaproteobacteria bacterium]MBJ55666.1 hypothetical protein [Gammaproteobacteria bacterium]HBN14364.1 hypothetical protein [Pseudohongiella sp.]|tara:strand:- start:368 stop:1117 length:750 start_codon:yes stop_codon:yes gene_type:complete